jgi:hypothetical protein
MPRWRPNATSNQDAGGGAAGARRLAIQCVGMGAGDTLKVGGRVPGVVAYVPIALKKKGTDAIIPGATGIVADGDVFHVDVTGLEVQLQYTKATNNGDINWSEEPG